MAGMDELTRLAVAARDGDRTSLERFVRSAQGDVWRLCRYLSDEHAADDLAQEALIRALRALPAFRADSSARTWILSIAQRTCADDVRRRARRRRLADRLANNVRADHVDDHAETHALGSLVRLLDLDRREAFVLTQVIGLSYDEAADVLGCPIGTIRSRVARARAQLAAAAGGSSAAKAHG